MQVIPVLKGNAYGHGIRQVAEALTGRKLTYIAVDGYFEALRIREVSNQPVLVMGAIKPENFKRLGNAKLAYVVGDEATINVLGKTGRRFKVHLECNTGMNRYGAKPDEMAKLTKLILSYKNLTIKGDKVSYNYTFTAPKDMKIGVLPLGYFEGVNRVLSNKGVIKIGDKFTPIVGRVCMNHTMISLEGLEAKVGDEVVVYSNNPKDKNAIDNIEAEHSLFDYSLLTSLSHDIRRLLVS